MLRGPNVRQNLGQAPQHESMQLWIIESWYTYMNFLHLQQWYISRSLKNTTCYICVVLFARLICDRLPIVLLPVVTGHKISKSVSHPYVVHSLLCDHDGWCKFVKDWVAVQYWSLEGNMDEFLVEVGLCRQWVSLLSWCLPRKVIHLEYLPFPFLSHSYSPCLNSLSALDLFCLWLKLFDSSFCPCPLL